MMLRPMVVDDFGKHLAGELAPLNVGEWREATVTTNFWKAHQVHHHVLHGQASESQGAASFILSLFLSCSSCVAVLHRKA